MSKRLRFIGRSWPQRFHHSDSEVINTCSLDVSYCDLALRHPSTGKQGVFNLRIHESGDVVIHGPSWGYRTLSRILGNGADDPKERIRRVIETGHHLQNELNKDYYLPK